ncbi:protocadherin Fat 4-like isoform X2 [Haliotis rufescens]|uniref:protocadherin Fat 4-like isoform X2 n=1 Tax=Haliotis rufescens TaxID=6454 RepID=UPI00201F409D|nr:protocadherin Fat 4-like isoform X2 [Haliotis rufescens]
MIRGSAVWLLLFMATTRAGRWSGVTTDNQQWYNAMNNDIDLIYRRNLIVAIRGCEGADMMFYQFVGAGEFVYVRMGDAGNSYSLMMASTHCTDDGCSVAAYETDAHLDCDNFKTFWFRWDNWGRFEVGKESTVGENLMMEMDYNVNGNDGAFMLRALETAATSDDKNVEFYYYIDEPPVMLSPSMGGGNIITLSEDTAIGTAILTTAGEDEEGDAIIFGTSGNHSDILGWFNDTYSTNATFDYESQKVYYVTLAATDGFNVINNGLTLFITDVDDENPVISAGDTAVQEELPIGTKVYAMFAVSDVDTFQTFTYDITVDADGVLKVAQRLDREVKDTVSVTVTVSDSASHDASTDLTLTVTDINDNVPICDQNIYFITIAEGTFDENIKLMEAINCNDKDDGSFSNMVATIVSGDTDNIFYFTGFEMFGSPKQVDYESLVGSNYSYYLTVHVTDQPSSGPVMTGTVNVVVQVSSANEQDPVWSSPPETAGAFPEETIAEDTQHGAVIVTYTAADGDHGVDGTLSYEIVSVTASDGSDGSGKFLVDSMNGELRASDILDTDTDTGGVSHYDIVVKAVDGGVTPKSVQATQRITLSNVNDNAPAFENAPLEVTVAEDASVGDVVMQLTVTDSDGDTPTLSTTESTMFTTSGSDLVTAATLDFETGTCYSVVVSATDGTFTTSLSLTVMVTNVNDEAPVIVVNTNFKMFEETPVDTVLAGSFVVNDADKGDTFTYSLAGADASYFTTTASGDLKIVNRISFSLRDVVFDVTVTDAAGHSATETLSIPVEDINDNSPRCEHNVYEVEVKELAGGYVKLKDAITCTDSDGGNNAVLQINITSGDDSGVFAFNGFELWGTPDNIDYEALAATNYRYYLTVVVQDTPDHGEPRTDNLAFIVTVTGENEFTPVFTSPSSSGGNFVDVTIAEDTSPGSILVSLVATDQDRGADGKVQYEMVSITTDSGGDGSGVFFVDSISGNVYVGKPLDSDTGTGGVAFYEMVVKAVDGGSTPLEIEGTMKVTLTNANDNAPVMTVVHDVMMSESAAVGDLVVEVTITDADGDTPTLTLGGDHAASFSVTGNEILLQSALDYDDRSKACLSLQVTASDGLHAVTEALTVTVEPANDVNPSISVSADRRMYEGLPIGTIVAGIFQVSDIDEGDTLTFSLSGPHASFFDISGSGELTISSTVDRETDGDTLTIIVNATDAASNVASETINITVVDINDNAPKCEQLLYTANVEEGGTNSDQKIMSALTCSDADAGDNAAFVATVTGGDSSGLFQYKDMELWGDASQINYEDLEATDYTYYLTVGVSDTPSKWPSLTGVVMVAVQVSEKNEFTPAFTSPVPTSGNFPDEMLNEDTVPGTAIVTYVATDDDHGDDGRVHYEIVSITTDTGNSAPNTFVIDRDSGSLRVGKALDADTGTGGVVSYDVVIKAADGGSTQKETQATQKLTLVGVNDNAPVFTDANFKFSVAEDVAVGHVVATLGVDDYDGDPVTLTVTGSHTAVFEGDATEPKILTLAALDYETTRCYSVEVDASDGTSSSTKTLTIAVTDIADTAPTLTGYDFVTIPEELDFGTVIGRLFELSDVDTQDSATYALSGTDSSSLAINETSGRVFVANAIDADNGVTSLGVTVTVTDSAALTGTVDVDVAVIDVNEFVPVFGEQIYKATVEENSASAKLVDVVCTDDDSGVNGDVELVIPTTDGADTIFSVSSMEVHVDGSQLDYEALEGTGYVYSLTLLCRDKPTHGKPLTGSVLVSVQVSGTDETPPVWSSPTVDGSNNFPGVTLSESVNPGAMVEEFTATDVDKGTQGSISYSIVSVISDSSADGRGIFGIDVTTGTLQTNIKLDADIATGGDSYYDIVVQASDGINNITGTIKVTLMDFSDNAPQFTKEFYTTTVPCTTLVDSTVLTLAADDIDSVGFAEFRFKDYSGSIFTMEANTGNVVLSTPTFHIGEDIYHTLAVTVTDSVNSDLMDESTVYIELEYCGPSNATTSSSTENPGCEQVTDDSAVVPMRIVTAVLAAGLIGVLGFSLRSILSVLRPDVPKVSPTFMKNKAGFERPLEPEPSIYVEDMTVQPSVDTGNYLPDNMMAEEYSKQHLMST